MSGLREAAQQALEALYQAREFTELYDTEHAAAVNERCHENIAVLRAALAQQAEPATLTHRHEWFSTGGMEPGQFRCIHCGAWAKEKSHE